MRSMQHEIACNNLLPFKHVNEGFQPKMQRRKESKAVLGSHLHFKKEDQTSALNDEWKLILADRATS